MSNNKHLADLIKVCSILPALVIMPAMATDYTSSDIEQYPFTVKAGDSLLVTEGYSNAEDGVFHNNGSLTIGDGLVFDKNNTTGYGATIYLYNENATYTNIGNNVVFSGGTALKDTGLYMGMGGAIYSWSDGEASGANVIEIGDNVAFRDNDAMVGGSAIYTYGYNDITIGDNLVMENNYSYQGAGGGGAIVLNGYDENNGDDFINTLTVGKNALFKDNSTLLRAGAVYIGGDANDKAVFDDGARFVGNRSSYGGAVAGFGTFEFGDVSFESNEAFNAWDQVIKNLGWSESYNSYVGNGGAVLNGGVFTINGNANFLTNKADGNGGAIYNGAGGIVNLLGDNTFSGNTANGVANDIFNAGTLNIVSGTTTIDGGIVGTGNLAIANGATLNIGATTLSQSSIELAGTLGASLLDVDNYAKIFGNISGDGLLKLSVGAAGTYNDVFSSDYSGNVDAGDVYNVSKDGKNIVVTTKSVDQVANDAGVSTLAANALVGLANHDDTKIHTVSLAAQQSLAKGDVATVEKETAKLRPTSQPVAHSVASSIQNQVLALTAGRMSTGMMGRNGGDVSADYGVWAQGLFNKAKHSDLFHGYTRGVALGFDANIDAFTFGVGYAFNNTDVHADDRDTNIDSNTLFLYSQYKPSEWYVNATVSYTMADYDEETSVYGLPFSASYNTDSFGVQSMVGYDFATGLTPEVGVRYLHIAQDKYYNGFANVDASDVDFLSGVAGVKYAFDIQSDTIVRWSPEMRVAATYDFISDDAFATVVIPGANSYVVNSDNLSRMGGEFGIGLTAEYKGLEISVNYELDLHKDYTSQTGLLKFRYDF